MLLSQLETFALSESRGAFITLIDIFSNVRPSSSNSQVFVLIRTFEICQNKPINS